MTTWAPHFLAFDTETTGLGKDARIIELSIVYFTHGTVVQEENFLLYPEGVDWESANVKKALSVNGITHDELRGRRTFSQQLRDIHQALEGEKLWVAHNAPFDTRMLQQEYDRLGEKMPEPSHVLDTMMLDTKLNKYERSRKLANVVTRWGVTLGGAHRAAADAIACGEVLWAMAKSGKLSNDLDFVCAQQQAARKSWDDYVRKKYQTSAPTSNPSNA